MGFLNTMLTLSSPFRDLFCRHFGTFLYTIPVGLFGCLLLSYLLGGFLDDSLACLRRLLGRLLGFRSLFGRFHGLFGRFLSSLGLSGRGRLGRAPGAGLAMCLGLDRPERQELAMDGAGDLVDGHHAVDGRELPPLGIVVNQRLRLVAVAGES